MIRKPDQHSLTFRITRSVVMAAVISAAAYFLILYFAFPAQQPAPNGFDNTLRIFPSFEASTATALVLSVLSLFWLLHIVIMVRVRRLTTHTIRDIITPIFLIPAIVLFLVNLLALIIEIPGLPGHSATFYSLLGSLLGLLAVILILGLRMHPLQAFSIPSNWISVIPLLLSYMMLLNPYVILAGMVFPSHRRLKEYWRPRPLPRLKEKKKGVTLIELLIVVAIVSILTPVVVRLASQARIASERLDVSRESVALIEDELALLRTQPALPAPGIHAIDPQVAGLHQNLAPLARVEISQTSSPLVQARVTVNLFEKGIGTSVSLATLIAPRKEAKP